MNSNNSSEPQPDLSDPYYYSSSFSEACQCRRTFTHLGAWKRHQNICTVTNGRLAAALAKARKAKEHKELEKARAGINLAISRAPSTSAVELGDPSLMTDSTESHTEVSAW